MAAPSSAHVDNALDVKDPMALGVVHTLRRDRPVAPAGAHLRTQRETGLGHPFHGVDDGLCLSWGAVVQLLEVP